VGYPVTYADVSLLGPAPGRVSAAAGCGEGHLSMLSVLKQVYEFCNASDSS
jgi:hypothetical protein